MSHRGHSAEHSAVQLEGGQAHSVAQLEGAASVLSPASRLQCDWTEKSSCPHGCRCASPLPGQLLVLWRSP